MSQPRVYSATEHRSPLAMHLCEKLPVSDCCAEHPLHVNTFSNWLKVYFENGTAAS